jgi:hypothetical protein
VIEQFAVTRDQVKTALEFAARSLDTSAPGRWCAILFDNGTPRGIAKELQHHSVREARAEGVDALRNGELLDAAEVLGFEVFVRPTPISSISSPRNRVNGSGSGLYRQRTPAASRQRWRKALTARLHLLRAWSVISTGR